MASLSLAFDILARDRASQALNNVGDATDKLGKKTKKLGEDTEKGSEKGRKSLRLLGDTFASASAGALGPLQEIADKFDVIERASEGASSKAGGRLLGIGAAALGAGTLLATLGSRETEAQGRLKAAIEASGKSFEDFAPQIEEATKAGEHFGNQASTTLDALNRLTITTHNPAEALRDLSVAQDVAAAKGITLAKAAELVGLTYNGSTRAGKQFGLHLVDTKKATNDLTNAQKNSVASTQKVKDAQQAYNDKLAIYQQTVKPTLAQQIALFRSSQDVAKAQDAAKAAAERLAQAQKAAGAAANAGAENVKKLAAVTKGQGEANADSFSGKLRALGARIEDTAGKFGKDYGGAINTAALATVAFGTLVETGAIAKLGGLIGKLGFTGKAFTTLRDVEVATSAEGSAAVVAGAATSEAALIAEGDTALATAGKLKLALGGLAGIAAIGVGAFPDVKDGLAGVPRYDQKLLDYAAKYKLSQSQFYALTKDPNASALVTGQSGGIDSRTEGRDARSATILKNVAPAVIKAGAKTGKAAGDATLAEFLKSIDGGSPANAALAAAGKAAAGAAKSAALSASTALRDAVKANFDEAKSILTDVLNQARQVRDTIGQALVSGSEITDVFGGSVNLNANHAFGPGADFAKVRKFFEDRIIKLRRFAAELRGLLKTGLDPKIVGQIAAAGVDQGGRLADALNGSSRGQLRQINALNDQVGRLGDSTGAAVADARFHKQIEEARRNAVYLGSKLDQANAHLASLSGKTNKTDPRTAAFLLGA